MKTELPYFDVCVANIPYQARPHPVLLPHFRSALHTQPPLLWAICVVFSPVTKLESPLFIPADLVAIDIQAAGPPAILSGGHHHVPA